MVGAPPGDAGEASPAVEPTAAAAASHALEVLEWAGVARALAAECATAAAARVAAALQPNLSDAEAAERVAEAEESRAIEQRETVPVSGVRDVAPLVDAAARGMVLGPADLSDIARSVEAIARLRAFLVDHAAVAPALARRGRVLSPLPRLVAAIDRAVDERGSVRDDASAELARLVQRRAALAVRVEARLDSLRREPDVAAALTDDYVTVRDGRHVLPVRTDRRSKVPGILHGRSASGQSVFVEPSELVDLNNDLRAVVIDIEEEVQRILRELSADVGLESAVIAASLDEHRNIDLAHARGRLADRFDARPVRRARDGALELRGLVHPLLVLMKQGAGGASAVVSNDVLMEPETSGLVISGPNTGGKTVLLKAIGLACLMTRAGLAACCAEGSRLPFIETVFADIGDEQSLQRSLSSFSGHVANLVGILAGCAAAPGRTLVLLDEVMSGTDPAEGAALAEALLEHLEALRARVVVTTHVGRLKAFAASRPRFENAGMEFDAKTLAPTFRVRMRVPGASAAILVAERWGMPLALIHRARELAGESAVGAEALLRDLDAARAEAGRLRDDASRLQREAASLRGEYESRVAALKKRDADELHVERQAFERELAALRREAAAVTQELQSRPSLPAAADAIRRLDELRGRLSGLASPAEGDAALAFGHAAPEALNLQPGAEVRSRSLGRVGRVVEGPDGRGRVKIALGRVTVQLPGEDLAPPGDAGAARERPVARAPRAPVEAERREADGPIPFTPQVERNTCDVRGLRVDESLDRVTRFLERASSVGERRVVIIHGHGTGALKRAVREALRDEPLSEAWRPGGAGEGGDGVTVVALQ